MNHFWQGFEKKANRNKAALKTVDQAIKEYNRKRIARMGLYSGNGIISRIQKKLPKLKLTRDEIVMAISGQSSHGRYK